MKLSNLICGYGHRAVVEGSASLTRGAVTVLLGANGSGKSTLLRTVCGARRPIAGCVTIEGHDVHALSATRRARLVSVVLTDRPAGADALTVAELVAIGRQPYTSLTGRLSPADRDAVARAIDAVGLADKSERRLGTLSDGERQKAMIARAVAQDTPVMVLDEPTGFLDVSARFAIMQLLGRLAAEGRSILLSTHDTAAALAIGPHIWALADGRLTPDPPPELLDGLYPGVCFDAAIGDFRPEWKGGGGL